MRLKAGDLRHQILIRRYSQIDDGKGAYTESWVTIAEPWAEVKGLAGRESVMNQVLQSISVYRIRIRWRPDILQKDQIRHGDLALNISSAEDPDGRREQLVIIADTAGVRDDAP